MRGLRLILIAALMVVVPTLQTDAKISAARMSLNSILPEAKLTNVSLADAFTFLQDITRANLHIDWKALEGVNVTKDTQVNLNLRNVRLEKVLQLILSEASGGQNLTFYIDQNIIEVTTLAEADKKLVTLVYYVDDIISSNMPFNPQLSGGAGGGQVQGGSVANGGGSGSGGGGSGGSVFTSNNNNNSNGATKDQRAQDLITLIEKLVRPDVWRDNGGTASISFYNGNLIITAPRSVHELIGGPVE